MDSPPARALLYGQTSRRLPYEKAAQFPRQFLLKPGAPPADHRESLGVCQHLDVIGRRWNANLHAFERLLEAMPAGARTGLDVGCGEGESTRRLREHVPEVLGLDSDAPSIELARSHGDDIQYLVGDIRWADLPEAAFDVVSAVAVLHHLDLRVGLERLRRLVRPGGLLLVVGLARSRSLHDYARDALDAVAVRRYTLLRGRWQTPAPKVWPPPLTYDQARSLALGILPGARF